DKVIRPPVEANSGLAAVLRGVIADFQHASGAEIVSIFLYEESTHSYYAPFATGQPQESLLDSLTDMHEQLTRYLADESQGKVPDDLAVHQYGSTVWLTVTRQHLAAHNSGRRREDERQRAPPAALDRARRPSHGKQPGRRGDLPVRPPTFTPRARHRASAGGGTHANRAQRSIHTVGRSAQENPG